VDPEATVLVLFAGLFFFALPIFLLVRSYSLGRQANSLEEENTALRDELRGVVRRVNSLETALKNLSLEPERTGSGAEASTGPNVAMPAAPSVVQPKPEPPPVQSPAPVAPKSAAPPAVATPPRQQPTVQAPRPSPFTLPEAAAPSHAALTPEPYRWADLEESLGANWLNKIGTAAFVIGVALLLNYSMHYLGPQGKIALGYALSIVFLLAGILGERKERYRIASRAVLGGGWALAYFTTYALRNIAAVRLVTNPVVGFGLLFAVAVAMVAHSLRYHSEVTTGFAYVLAFASVAVSNIPIGALIASALLAASLVVILRARRWYVLEPLAIVATYGVHWLWLNQVFEKIGGRKPFPELAASAALLFVYWLIYLISYFLREERGAKEQQLLTASFLLNAAGYLAVVHYQAFHPELRFWFLLGTGLVYLGMSAYSRRAGRRWGFILASTLGAALAIAAVPYRYSGRGLEIFWLIEAEALLIVGWRAADAHLRKLGWIATEALAVYVLFFDLSPRFEIWQPPDARMGWMLLALAGAFYLNSRFKDRFGSQADEIDEVASRLSPGLATGFLLAAAWVALPFLWTGLVWMVIAVLLNEAGRRLRDHVLHICGHGSALLAVARLLSVDMLHTDAWHNITLRLITVSCSSALLYLSASRGGFSKQAGDKAISGGVADSPWLSRVGGPPAMYTWAATLLVAVLLWNEAATAAIGLAWGLFGLALLEAARALHDDRPLILQGRALLLASFGRIFFADLNSTARMGPIPAPVLTVTLLAVIYFFTGFNSDENSSRARGLFLWLGTVSLAALCRFQLQPEWVAVSWAAMAVALYVLGRRFDLLTFREQSYAMAVLVGIRCAFDNFYQVGPWHFTNIRIASVVSSSALLYILFGMAQLTKGDRRAAFAQRRSDQAEQKRAQVVRALLEMYPQHLFFFVPTILLTVLLSLEVRRGFLTAAWGLEALVVFLAVLKMDERAYRWFSLLLFLLCAGRIVTVDVWNLDALGRIVSFMGLGAALLAVSFLYARHRETLRRVL